MQLHKAKLSSPLSSTIYHLQSLKNSFNKNYKMDHCIICDQLDYREVVGSGEAITVKTAREPPPLNSTPALFSDNDFQSKVCSVNPFIKFLIYLSPISLSDFIGIPSDLKK